MNAWNTPDVGQLLRSIRHYTKFVDFSKLLLGLFALVLVSAVIIIPLRDNGDNKARLVFSSIEKSTVTEKPKMTHLKYRGTDSKNQPFTVTADSGVQLPDERIQLENPIADITLQDGKWAAISSRQGVLDNKGKQVDLKGLVDVIYDQVYEFTTEAMHVDIDARKITSDLPVKGHGPAGTIYARGGFEATQEDQRILFFGPVHTVIYTGGGK
jgi:lipopolysaccharide export system protein LptC